MCMIAERWRELDEDEKKPYEEMAAQDRKRYEREMKAYNEEGTFWTTMQIFQLHSGGDNHSFTSM